MALISYASVNAVIVSALRDLFGPDSNGQLPVTHLEYDGDAESYVIFRSNARPDVYSSGGNRSVVSDCYLDLFTAQDASGKTGLTGRVVKALDTNSMVKVQDVNDLGRDPETGIYHTEIVVLIETRF